MTTVDYQAVRVAHTSTNGPRTTRCTAHPDAATTSANLPGSHAVY